MRKFNSTAYNAHDNNTKNMVINIMEATGKYVFEGDLDVELYKECDIRMKHIETGVIVRFENECRINFLELVSKYDTIHIPTRKRNTQADFYMVWNYELTQFILINRDALIKHRKSVVNVDCSATRNATHDYSEDFMDIPKLDCTWYVIGKNYKLVTMNWPE